ncbi:MAG: YibE/F family protein [Clostridia bacterium]|nr:YibE/F family protein [Clostridia bacterium]
MYKKIVLILLTLMVFSFCSGIAIGYEEIDEFNLSEAYAKGKVLEIYEEKLEQEISEGILENYQRILVEITSGDFKGRKVQIENSFINSPGYEIYVQEGDKVLLSVLYDDSGYQKAYVVDFVRDIYIYLLIGIFVLLMLLIGRSKGLKGLISLGVTFLVIYKIMIPQIFAGRSPVLVTILSSVVIAFITFAIVSGFTKKSVSAFLGTGAGLILAAVLAMIISNVANLTGLSTEESRMLFYVPEFADYNMKGILLSGIILGALGAVMDVCMSIASSTEEIANAGENMSFAHLFKAGMNVGNDVMGTMTNTLVLAYTGASLPLLLLLMAYELPFLHLINFEMLADEIIRALIGTIALVAAIPITAFISALLLKHKS